MNFIYVFNKRDRDILVDRGYTLIKSNKKKNVYVFEAKSVVDYSLDGIKMCYSNVLTF